MSTDQLEGTVTIETGMTRLMHICVVTKRFLTQQVTTEGIYNVILPTGIQYRLCTLELPSCKSERAGVLILTPIWHWLKSASWTLILWYFCPAIQVAMWALEDRGYWYAKKCWCWQLEVKLVSVERVCARRYGRGTGSVCHGGWGAFEAARGLMWGTWNSSPQCCAPQ